jgi:hypothetical protein
LLQNTNRVRLLLVSCFLFSVFFFLHNKENKIFFKYKWSDP